MQAPHHGSAFLCQRFTAQPINFVNQTTILHTCGGGKRHLLHRSLTLFDLIGNRAQVPS